MPPAKMIRVDSQSPANEDIQTDSEKENIVPSTSLKRTTIEWKFMISYNTKKDLETYIASHNCFYVHSSNSCEDGRITYHYCNMVPARSARLCPVKLKVFESNTSVSFGVSVTTFIHDHSAITSKTKAHFF